MPRGDVADKLTINTRGNESHKYFHAAFPRFSPGFPRNSRITLRRLTFVSPEALYEACDGPKRCFSNYKAISPSVSRAKRTIGSPFRLLTWYLIPLTCIWGPIGPLAGTPIMSGSIMRTSTSTSRKGVRFRVVFRRIILDVFLLLSRELRGRDLAR